MALVLDYKELGDSKKGMIKLAKSRRGKRDGTGPRKGSYQQRKYGIGKRRKAGQSCPKR